MVNQENLNGFQKAMMYDSLAQYYKYSDPDQHIHYYKKHIKQLKMAIQINEDPSMPLEYVHSRFINLLPNAADILLNGQVAIENIPGNGLSEYFLLPTNTYQLEVVQKGDTAKSPSRHTLEIKQDRFSSYVITESGVYHYPSEQFVPEDETKLRVIHLLENAPSFDVRVWHGDIVFPQLTYSASSDYLGLTPMTLDLELTVAKSKNLLFKLPKLRLKADDVYTLVIAGDVKHPDNIHPLLIRD
jgi:hypothetical protein